MPFCSQCGGHLGPTAKFCSQCGTKVALTQSTPTIQGNRSRPTSRSSVKSSSSNDKEPVTEENFPSRIGQRQHLSSGDRQRSMAVGHAVSPSTTIKGLQQPMSKRGAEIRRAMDEFEDEVFDPQFFSNVRVSEPRGRQSQWQKLIFKDVSPLKVRWHSRDGPLDPAGRRFDASDRNILCMAVHAPRNEAVVGSADHGLKVFDLDKCKLKRNLYTKKYGHTEWVTGCCFLSDGRIMSGGMDNKLCLWAASLVKCDDLIAHKASVSKVESNSSDIVISASYDRTLMVWDCTTATANCAKILTGHKKPVMDFIWYHNHLVSGDREGILKKWDVEVGTCTEDLVGNQGQTAALGWLLDNTANVVLSGAQDGQLRVWDARAGSTPQHTLHLHPGGAVTAVKSTFFHDTLRANLVVTAGADRAIKVLDPRASFAALHTLRDHKDFIYSLETHDDLILSGAGNGWLLAHDINTGACLYGLGANQAAVRCIWANQSRLVTAGDDGKAVVFDF
eukprot:EG_transcript_8678